MAVMLQVDLFSVVTPCSVVVGYQRFGSPYRLHLHFTSVNPKKGNSMDL